MKVKPTITNSLIIAADLIIMANHNYNVQYHNARKINLLAISGLSL